MQAHFGKQMPLLFLYVKESACARARKMLKMASSQSFYLDVSSSDETQKRITILPEKISDENKATLKLNFGVESAGAVTAMDQMAGHRCFWIVQNDDYESVTNNAKKMNLKL